MLKNGFFQWTHECIPNPVRRGANEARLIFSGTTISNPSHPISSETTFDLGGLTVRVIPTPGHTPANLSVFVPDDSVLYCGDCIVNGYIPNLEGGAPADWRTWLVSLDRIMALAPRFVVPGHGWVLRDEAILHEIQRVRHILEEALATGRPPTQAE